MLPITGIESIAWNLILSTEPAAPVFGVKWLGGPDPTLERTDDAVGMTAAAGVDGQVVRNDFDSAPIYREITEVTDAYGNRFVRIPKFYIFKNGPGIIKISKKRYPGFYLPWCFWDFENGRELPYVDVGKYPASLSSDGQRLESKPGVKPLGNKTIVEFRQLARANGKGYQLLDIHAWDVIQCLFWIEFATLDSQSIMRGLVDASAAATNGATDGVAASSGSPNSNTDGLNPCKYRGIESPWGNVWQWLDGLNINDRRAWVCRNAEEYASNVFAAPYEQLAYTSASESGYITQLGFDVNHPYAMLPVAVGGSSSTYYADYYYQSIGQRVARVGGDRMTGSEAGLSYWSLSSPTSFAYSLVGGRLVRKAL